MESGNLNSSFAVSVIWLFQTIWRMLVCLKISYPKTQWVTSFFLSNCHNQDVPHFPTNPFWNNDPNIANSSKLLSNVQVAKFFSTLTYSEFSFVIYFKSCSVNESIWIDFWIWMPHTIDFAGISPYISIGTPYINFPRNIPIVSRWTGEHIAMFLLRRPSPTRRDFFRLRAPVSRCHHFCSSLFGRSLDVSPMPQKKYPAW